MESPDWSAKTINQNKSKQDLDVTRALKDRTPFLHTHTHTRKKISFLKILKSKQRRWHHHPAYGRKGTCGASGPQALEIPNQAKLGQPKFLPITSQFWHLHRRVRQRQTHTERGGERKE